MVISKKTAIGGTILGGGSIGAGVGISQMTGELPINKDLEKRISLVKERFDFDLESDECKNSLKVRDNSDYNYRSAFVSCSQSKKLSDLAEKAGLDVLSKENKSNSGLFGGDNNKEEVLEATKIPTGTENNEEKKINEVAAGCEKQEFSTDTKDEQGHNFLVACTKNGKIGLTGIKTEMVTVGVNDSNKDKYMNGFKKESGKEYLGIKTKTPKIAILGTSKVDERNEHLSKDLGYGKETISYKVRASGFRFEGTKSEDCNRALTQELSDSNFKSAIKTCFGTKKFSDRAKALGFNVVPTTATNNDDGKGLGEFKKEKAGEKRQKLGEMIESVGEKIRERIKKAINNSWSPSGTGNTDHTKIKTHCESNTNNESFSQNPSDTEGQNYLKACTKNKSISKIFSENSKELAIDFGTGKYTVEVSQTK